ncbi:hypothetical protein EYR40_008859 [Pleurotus pulmonarius]|nr:hypothetical protein EYR40_008859 [Pleurotus pulmonarius]
MPPQASSNEPPILANGMALRVHRNKNVGAPDMKRPRRPNGEVAAEKAEKKSKKISDDKLRKQNFREVARLEQAAKVADKENHRRPTLPARSKVTLERSVEIVPDSEDERVREQKTKNMERKEKKRLARSLIEVERAAMDHGNAPTKIKRKADKAIIAEFDQGPLHAVSCSHGHRSFAKKAKTLKAPGGLRADWSIGKDNVPAQPAAHHHGQDSEREPIGGISDDESISGERAALDINPTAPRFKSLARVNLAPVTPTPQLSAKRQHALRRKITRNDLPDGIRRQFYDSYIPYAIRLAGYKEAWYNPTYNDAYHSWLAVLATSEEGYGQPSEDHIFVAEKLINIHISQIRNKTKEAAVKALDILLRNENMKTIEEKADYVKWLQGEGLYDNAPPFYYKTIEDDGKKKGVFQSFLISFTFSLHLAAISGVPDDFESHSIEQPGALVMAIQAVKRALFYYRSGIKEEPNPRDTLSHFSHSNWADHEEKTTDEYGNIVTKVVPTTSSITKLVNKLTLRQWEKIIEEAAQFTLNETEPLPSVAIGQYDEEPELIDDDDELQPQQSAGSNAGTPAIPAAHDNDFRSQPVPSGSGLSHSDDLLDLDRSGSSDNGDYNDGDVEMSDNDQDSDSSTESDPEMPNFMPSQSIIKWVSYGGESD